MTVKSERSLPIALAVVVNLSNGSDIDLIRDTLRAYFNNYHRAGDTVTMYVHEALPGGQPDLRAVQCEACHGPGHRHRGKGGIRVRVPEKVCRECHNTENSPVFTYEGYLKKLGMHTLKYFHRPKELR